MHKYKYKHTKHHTCIYIDIQIGILLANVKTNADAYIYAYTNIYM